LTTSVLPTVDWTIRSIAAGIAFAGFRCLLIKVSTPSSQNNVGAKVVV
jgi:hypothetical protein